MEIFDPTRRSQSVEFNLGTNAQAQEIEATLPAIGSAVGGPIGSAIGQALQIITGLFGGKTHLTAGGETYRVAEKTFYTQADQIAALYAAAGQTNPFPPRPSNMDGGPAILWVTTCIGILLGNPSLASSSSGNLDTLKKNGTYDQALHAQTALLQTLMADTQATQTTGSLTNSAVSIVSNYWPYILGAVVLYKVLGD